MSAWSGEMSRLTPQLKELREQLCDHAVHGAGRFQLSRREQALTAVMLLISAADEVAKAAGITPAFQGWCAAQVPAKGVVLQ